MTHRAGALEEPKGDVACAGALERQRQRLAENLADVAQVSEGREKHVGVDIDRKAIVDIGYRKFAPSGTRLEQCGDPDLINETRKGISSWRAAAPETLRLRVGSEVCSTSRVLIN
jgi:hypothetical protein